MQCLHLTLIFPLLIHSHMFWTRTARTHAYISKRFQTLASALSQHTPFYKCLIRAMFSSILCKAITVFNLQHTTMHMRCQKCESLLLSLSLSLSSSLGMCTHINEAYILCLKTKSIRLRMKTSKWKEIVCSQEIELISSSNNNNSNNQNNNDKLNTKRMVRWRRDVSYALQHISTNMYAHRMRYLWPK